MRTVRISIEAKACELSTEVIVDGDDEAEAEEAGKAAMEFLLSFSKGMAEADR